MFSRITKDFRTKIFIPASILTFFLLIFISFRFYEIEKNKNIRVSKAIIDKYNEDLKLNDYILLKSYNVNESDKGGFYWWVHQVASLVKLGELTNKKVIVYFNDGYYMDPEHPEESWWSYFYKYPRLSQKQLDLIKAAELVGYEEVLSLNLPKTDKMYLFTNKTFQKVMRNKMRDITQVYNRFIRFQDVVNDEIVDFVKSSGFDLNPNTHKIGVHYRGTDKFFANGDKEDMVHNKHAEYDVVVKYVEKEVLKTPKDKDFIIYVASDEQPFVDKIEEVFGNKVISYNAFRSEVDTSGMELVDTTKVKTNNNTASGRILLEMAGKSVHRGYPEISGYKKGLDAIVDVWLLSKCNVFVKSQRGNFSSQPKKINPDITVVEVV